jgi:hypothetical protein
MSDQNKNARTIAKLIEDAGADASDFPDSDDPWDSPAPSVTQPAPRLIRMGSVGKVAPRDWLVKNILAQGEMSALFAPSGGGKSFIALDMAARIAMGLPWFGHKVEKTGVLYVAGEGATGFQYRMIAWEREMKIGDADFHLLPEALDFYSSDGSGHSIIDAAIASIKNDYQVNVGLIVLDTLSQMMPGGVDSDPRDMERFIGHVKRLRLRTGAHVMLVHHTGKDKDRGMRGWSGLGAACDTVFEVTRPDDGGPHIIRIDKQKDGPDKVTFMCYIKPVTLGIDDDDDAITSCVLTPVGDDETHGNPTTTGQARIALDALDEALKTDAEAPPVTPEFENVTRIVTLESWSDHFDLLFETRKKGGFASDAARRQAWSRVKKTLLNKGLIKIEGGFAWRV